MKENSPEQNSLPSPEEEGLIRRSTKKQRGESPSFLPPRTLRTYKDSLVNPEGAWQDHTMSDSIHTEELIGAMKGNSELFTKPQNTLLKLLLIWPRRGKGKSDLVNNYRLGRHYLHLK